MKRFFHPLQQGIIREIQNETTSRFLLSHLFDGAWMRGLRGICSKQSSQSSPLIPLQIKTFELCGSSDKYLNISAKNINEGEFSKNLLIMKMNYGTLKTCVAEGCCLFNFRKYFFIRNLMLSNWPMAKN